MKKMLKAITATLLCASVSTALLTAVPAVCAEEKSTVALTFSGTADLSGRRDILDEYVLNDGSAIKIVNGRNVYSYTPANDSYELEYTFPAQQTYNEDAGQTGTLSLISDVKSACINRSSGKLYFAQDKYKAFNKIEGLTVEVFTYDLERGSLISSFEVAGESVSSVGADDSGNVYLGVRCHNENIGNSTGMRVFDSNGNKLASADFDNATDGFAAFLSDGSFYTTEVERVWAGGNSFSVTRYLRKSSFKNGTLSIGASPERRLNYNYNRPAASIGSGLIGICDGEVISTENGLTVHGFDIGKTVNDEYCASHNGVNILYSGDSVYLLSGGNRIKRLRTSDYALTASYQAEDTVFNFVPCKDGLALLLKNGSDFRIEQVGFDDFSEVEAEVINLNSLDIYQRSMADIVKKFAESMPQDYDEQFFESEGSVSAPYSEYTLTEKTRENAVTAANYFRWLEGLSGFTASSDDIWSNAAKGAVLTQVNTELTGYLSHYPAQPSDMDSDFYLKGKKATTTSNIAYGFGTGQKAIPDLLRGFINDEGYTDIPGHRDTFFTRNGDKFAAGYAERGAVNTIQYSGTSNPSGESVVGNNQPAYAWPTPGAFPEEETVVGSLWTVNINYDYVKLTGASPNVTITDLGTGDKFIRDSEETGVYTTSSWGKYISFAPPETTSYSGKSYKVTIENLMSSDDVPLTIEYTINFFSYGDELEIDGKTYTCDKYGKLSEVLPEFILGDVNGDGDVTVEDVTMISRYNAEYIELDEIQQLAGDVDHDGAVTVSDATLIQRYLAEFIDKLE